MPKEEQKNGKGLTPIAYGMSLHQSKYIAEIVVSTDSKEIAANLREHFPLVTILDRPEAIRGDLVSMNDIIAYDLSQVEGEHFLQTHSTNPLMTVNTIDAAIECYFSSLGKYDSLFSVTPRQVRLYWKDGKAINHDPEQLLPTQHLEPIYQENSRLYVFSRTSFYQSGNWRIGLKPQMFEMDKLEAVDIDEEEDFRLAEALHKLKYVSGACSE